MNLALQEVVEKNCSWSCTTKVLLSSLKRVRARSVNRYGTNQVMVFSLSYPYLSIKNRLIHILSLPVKIND
jgi:hypothetical protein